MRKKCFRLPRASGQKRRQADRQTATHTQTVIQCGEWYKRYRYEVLPAEESGVDGITGLHMQGWGGSQAGQTGRKTAFQAVGRAWHRQQPYRSVCARIPIDLQGPKSLEHFFDGTQDCLPRAHSTQPFPFTTFLPHIAPPRIHPPHPTPHPLNTHTHSTP